MSQLVPIWHCDLGPGQSISFQFSLFKVVMNHACKHSHEDPWKIKKVKVIKGTE